QRAREGDDAALRRAVGVCVGRAAQGRDRGGVDNHATAPLDQHWDAVFADEEDAGQVDGDDPVPVLFGCVDHVVHGDAHALRSRVADARVVVEEVDPAEGAPGRVQHGLHVLRAGDVGDGADGTAAGLGDGLDGRVNGALVEIVDNDLCPFA